MTSATPAPRLRLDWIDAARGISIVWIAWFHFFITWAHGRLPWPFNPAYFSLYTESCGATTVPGRLGCHAEALFVAASQLGSQAVGVFLLLSGFGLVYALGPATAPARGWRDWVRARLLRLFPMYWAAHLVYLISPLLVRRDPVDWRFLASFLGDRVWPPDLFYYANPAWWFFGLILQLYLVFPLLVAGLRRLGPWPFLLACIAFTIASRGLLLFVLHANGNFVQGAFFGSRLWEFAAGMVLGYGLRHARERTLALVLGPAGLASGAVLYALGFWSYRPGFSFTCTDGLVGTGLFLLLAHLGHALLRLPGLRTPLVLLGVYSYGFYLLHEPYVLWAGEHLRALPLWTFTAAAAPILALLAVGSGLLENRVNRATQRLLAARTAPAAPSAQGTGV